MKQYIFRNSTVEHLFSAHETNFSGYGDITIPNNTYDRFIWFYLPKLNGDISVIANELDEEFEKFYFVFNQVQKDFLIILPSIYYLHVWENSSNELSNALINLEERFFKLAQTNKLINLLDIKDFCKNYAAHDFLDLRYYYSSDIIVNPKLGKDFRKWFNFKVNAIHNVRKKCLIVDLDNTLWGGVIGEDGYNKVTIGDSYPGLVYKEFQSYLLEASRKGIILAICSKNNIEDVREIFTKNHEMVLKLEHFSCIRANWNLKSENIREISEELNIGLDSIVFIDDNPMERELVKSFLPEVVVPDFPEHPYQLVSNFLSIYNSNFQVHKLTNEDMVKTEQYLSNNQRKLESLKFTNFEEYLESLNIEIEVFECNDGNIERIAQMTQKTNQFNLTSKRYTIQELQIHKKAGSIVTCFRVKDKFGDNGITALSIIEFKEGDAYLDTFLLSCRILGRKIEFAVMKYLENLLYIRQIENFKATFTKTDKNKVSETFLENAGFEIISELENTKHYSLALQKRAEIENYYKFIEVI